MFYPASCYFVLDWFRQWLSPALRHDQEIGQALLTGDSPARLGNELSTNDWSFLASTAPGLAWGQGHPRLAQDDDSPCVAIHLSAPERQVLRPCPSPAILQTAESCVTPNGPHALSCGISAFQACPSEAISPSGPIQIEPADTHPALPTSLSGSTTCSVDSCGTDSWQSSSCSCSEDASEDGGHLSLAPDESWSPRGCHDDTVPYDHNGVPTGHTLRGEPPPAPSSSIRSAAQASAQIPCPSPSSLTASCQASSLVLESCNTAAVLIIPPAVAAVVAPTGAVTACCDDGLTFSVACTSTRSCTAHGASGCGVACDRAGICLAATRDADREEGAVGTSLCAGPPAQEAERSDSALLAGLAPLVLPSLPCSRGSTCDRLELMQLGLEQEVCQAAPRVLESEVDVLLGLVVADALWGGSEE